MGRFSVLLKPPANVVSGARVVARLNVPEAILSQTGPITLTATLNGASIGSQTWSSSGEYTFEAPVPAAALGPDPVTIDFALDKYLPAGKAETRELGLIVTSIEIASS
jgi:hypothetical protein